MTILEARQLTKMYTLAEQEVCALDAVSFSVAKGNFVVIQGSSGSGKTTLLTLLSGLDQPTSGSVWVNGRDITVTSEDEMAAFRNAYIGFVFQGFHLVPSLTALENVMFPAEIRKDARAREKAEQLLNRVGLDRRFHNLPHQLSGGEKQRVAICRAVINDPKIIFADEPTGNLDSENGRIILDLLISFQRERQSTLVLVTHNQAIADRAEGRITLRDGRILPAESSDAA